MTGRDHTRDLGLLGSLLADGDGHDLVVHESCPDRQAGDHVARRSVIAIQSDLDLGRHGMDSCLVVDPERDSILPSSLSVVDRTMPVTSVSSAASSPMAMATTSSSTRVARTVRPGTTSLAGASAPSTVIWTSGETA